MQLWWPLPPFEQVLWTSCSVYLCLWSYQRRGLQQLNRCRAPGPTVLLSLFLSLNWTRPSQRLQVAHLFVFSFHLTTPNTSPRSPTHIYITDTAELYIYSLCWYMFCLDLPSSIRSVVFWSHMFSIMFSGLGCSADKHGQVVTFTSIQHSIVSQWLCLVSLYPVGNIYYLLL